MSTMRGLHPTPGRQGSGTIPGMGVLHIKGFDDDLQRRLRIAAAEHDTSMKAIIEQAVRRELDRLERRRR